MRMVAAVCVVFAVSSAVAADPGAMLARGREHIQRQQYAAAVRVLHEALAEAEKLEAAAQRSQALAALHFYTAVAFSGMNNDAHTRQELQEFFSLNPEMRSIDAAKFDPAFVRRFREARKTFDAAATSNFSLFYPGFAKTEVPVEPSIAGWNDGPEITLLASAQERQEWKTTSDEESRRRFIEAFWQRRGEAFRREFLRRVAFADDKFASAGVRGSLTDRGRVFMVLGPPRSIRQSHLTSLDAGRGLGKLAIGTPIVRGEVEQWFYGKDQFPKSIPDEQLVFKFVTEAEYGDGVLQRDPLLIRALHEAGHTVP
jgi:GWxTD domain-containing protein